MRSSSIWELPFSWTASAVAHGVAMAVLWSIGTPSTTWIMDSGVITGQSVQLEAQFLPETEQEEEVTTHVVFPTSLSETTRLAVQRVETAAEIEVPAESPEFEVLPQLEPRETQRSATLKKEVTNPEQEMKARTRPVALPTVVADQITLPAIPGAAVDVLPRQRATNRPPPYPDDALLAKRDGVVMIRAMISDDGHVSKVEIETSSGTPSLDAAALTAVTHWHFTPARREGIAVEYEILVPVRFRL